MITNLTNNHLRYGSFFPELPSYSVIRLSNTDEQGNHLSQRHIGTYATLEEAEFIVRKATKMEKASILAKMQTNNPTSYAFREMTLRDIKLNDTVYNIVEPIMDDVTPAYTNGISNVTHYMRELRGPEKRIAAVEADSEGAVLSFKQFCMVQEAMPKLTSRRHQHWTQDEIDDALAS